MRKFLLSFLMALAGTSMVSAVTPTLYGNQIYNKTWGQGEGGKTGIYSFTADNTGDVTLVYNADGAGVYGNGGAVYCDGKFYVLTHMPESNATSNILYTYNADTWVLESQIDAPLTTTANDLTWCPVDNKIYGVFLNTTKSGYVFGTLNLTNGEVNAIKAIELKDNLGPMPMIALAANTEGDVYGIGADGVLYLFDRTTGDCTEVGDTGFKPARWNQSACFDFTTKELYWAACNQETSALFKVDTSSGLATAVRNFSNDEEFVGLFSINSAADLKGPQAPEGLAVDLKGNALTATLSFTLPSSTISGETLTGNLDYVVEDNGEAIIKAVAAAGSKVSRDITLTEGLHTLIVYATTADGKGASSRQTVYAGNDTPSAPASATANLKDDKVTISWDAVTTGFNKGYIDASAVKYTVTRMPDAKVIGTDLTATTVDDTTLPSTLGDYTYQVEAVYAGKTGKAAVTAPLTLGKAMEAPLAIDLTEEDNFKFFTVTDANEDNKTWKWTVNGVQCEYDRNNASDDWLISPMVNLKAGYQYILTYEMRAGNSRYEETFEIMAGNATNVDALTIPILKDGATKDNTRHATSFEFIPEKDGAYCFGVHCNSPKYQYSLYVYTFAISEPYSLKAPVASETVTAKAAEQGALKATITAIAPSKAIDGTALTALEKMEVTNLTSGKVAGIALNPEVGKEASVTDETAVNGVNKYAVAFYSAEGKGYAANVEVYVGEDTPETVSNVKLAQSGKQAVLTWEAPTKGVNGGYINPDNLTYRVVDLSNKADVATGLKELTYTDNNQSEEQHMLQYAVYASNVAGESQGYSSNGLVFGTPIDAPFSESFAGGKESTGPWTTEKEGTGYPDWVTTTNSMYDESDRAQDGDAGWMKYSSKGTITLRTPVLNIGTLSKPAVKLWYRAEDEDETGVDFQVLVSTDRGLTWQTLFNKAVTSTEWTPVTVSLASVTDKDAVMLGFRASCNDYIDMSIDNLRVTNDYANDLALTSLSGPATVDAGATATYSVRLSNEGTNAATGYSVEILGADKVLGSVAGEEIAVNGSTIVKVDVTYPINFTENEITAVVKFAADEYADNNKAELAVEITRPRLPVIPTLEATTEGSNVHLKWTRPAEERNPSAITDDLENLTAWDFGGVDAETAAGTIGNYKVYDADRDNTVVANTWFVQPNGGKPMAFQVNKTGGRYPDVDLTSYSINARSGNYSLIAWGGNTKETSDWLILPELYPGETKISFWAHSASMSYGSAMTYPEKIEILYSTTGNEIADFTSLVKDVEVPAGFDSDAEKGFHSFSYTLPDDAKYAAIRVSLYTTNNKAVVIDDLSYTPASAPKEKLEISGYNIYRDGTKVGTSEKEEFIDEPEAGDHTYNVTTRYSIGESPLSNDVNIATTGVEDITVGDIDGEVRFFNLQGVEVFNPVRGNVYIVVRSNGTSTKMVLR